MVLKLSYMFYVCVKQLTLFGKTWFFNVNNIILGEIQLNPNNRVDNFIIFSSKQYIFPVCLKIENPHYVDYYVTLE